ncbi:hypothetical protein VOLCADRAFT_94581 [Volvox carteri f. nagariensis]|uniref:Uncharacterized protein n=1 Tax=Volvox carteri f. nagariensis TaxID=3068 RepID=D8U561_VOLCA|nr:uncharacterized protein VOLCADRAFT_94581 [Volvox carteri f. nagariensis]EFJ45092.1 hypothetical protein VOLCADRAFT_94581 [Volvox carteri f. nagariensis]|eukprot:XP_002953768.1 hypothetical protein VOLCADRAFT_94581 [Volvox carteri f. nagariensis]
MDPHYFRCVEAEGAAAQPRSGGDGCEPPEPRESVTSAAATTTAPPATAHQTPPAQVPIINTNTYSNASGSGAAALRRRRTPAVIPPPSLLRVTPGERGSGCTASAELRAVFPVPPAVVFGLLTHPDKSGAFSNILEVYDRVEVTPPPPPGRPAVESSPGEAAAAAAAAAAANSPRFRVFEETQVGETALLWRHSKFRNRVRLEEDARDPGLMVQRFKLLHGADRGSDPQDNLERFEGSWFVSSVQGPELEPEVDELEKVVVGEVQVQVEVEVEVEEPQFVEVGIRDDADAAGGAEDDGVQVENLVSVARGEGGGDGDISSCTEDTHSPHPESVEDGWEDVGESPVLVTANTVAAVGVAVTGANGCGVSELSVVDTAAGAATAPDGPAAAPAAAGDAAPEIGSSGSDDAAATTAQIGSSSSGNGSGAAADSPAVAIGLGRDVQTPPPSLPPRLLTPTTMSAQAARAAGAASSSSSYGGAGGWCLVVLKHGLTPKGVPLLVRAAAAVSRLHQDLKKMVEKVLQGATVDEAVAAVRGEHSAHHRAHKQLHQQHHRHQNRHQEKGRPEVKHHDRPLPPQDTAVAASGSSVGDSSSGGGGPSMQRTPAVAAEPWVPEPV